MTHDINGGKPPISDAWGQAEDLYLSGSVPASLTGDGFKFELSDKPTKESFLLVAPTSSGMAVTAERLLRMLGNINAPRTLPVIALASALLFSSSLIPLASAQTVFGGSRAGRSAVPTTPPPKAATAQPAAAQPVSTVKTHQQRQAEAASPAPQTATAELPVSQGVIKQATAQIDGNFPAMKRAEVGGQIQDAWNDAKPRDAVQTFRLCEDCVYKIRTREFMTTTLVLPADAQIASADLGDGAGFQVKQKAANMLAVRPVSYGLDTNLNVYTQSGRVYPFYLRAESFNSKNIPDVLVKIIGSETPPKIETLEIEGGPVTAGAASIDGAGKDAEPKDGKKPPKEGKGADKIASAVDALTHPKSDSGDFVRSVPFDPSKLHGWNDYRLWGGGDSAKELKPIVVYRDDFFTYLQYGKKFDTLEDLPTAYVVKDGIDELVNTRVQGNTFIIENLASLITLKDGKSFLCIQYVGENP